MSYDLMFTSRSEEGINRKAFASYFRGRGNYELGKDQAVYQNEDTGVYFIFDAPEDGVVEFNLNYFRPHVFGLEAAPELEAFAEAMDAAAGDPQGEMPEDGTYSQDAFLKGWNDGNQFAFRAMLKDCSGPVHTWPATKIHSVWEWNYGRRVMQQQEGENVFVPGIFAVEQDGEVLSVAIWPPECAILMPEADAVLVPLAQSGKESENLALVRWDEILPIVELYAAGTDGQPRYRLAFEQWPPDIAAFLARQRQPMSPINGIGLDQVLDLELVQAACRS